MDQTLISPTPDFSNLSYVVHDLGAQASPRIESEKLLEVRFKALRAPPPVCGGCRGKGKDRTHVLVLCVKSHENLKAFQRSNVAGKLI